MPAKSVSIEVYKLSDHAMIESLFRAVKEAEETVSRIELNYQFQDEQQVLEGNQFESDPLFKIVRSRNVELVERCKMCVDDIELIYQRKSDSPYDQLSVNPAQHSTDVLRFINVAAAVQKEIQAAGPSRNLAEFMGSEGMRLQQAREETVGKLELLVSSSVEKITDKATLLEDRVADRREALEKEFKNKEAELEINVSAQQEQLAKERTEFESEKAELDDRESKHVRRELREQFKKAIGNLEETMTMTEMTRQLHSRVNRISGALLLSLAIGLAYHISFSTPKRSAYIEAQGTTVSSSSSEKTSTNEPEIGAVDQVFFYGTQAGLALGVSLTATFLIRWNGRWFQQRAQQELRFKRYSVDIERASWLVETGLEWKNETGTEVPDTLVQRLSRGLFTDEEGEIPDLHPADQLASAIMGTAASVKLKVGENEVNLDKKAIGKLSND